MIPDIKYSRRLFVKTTMIMVGTITTGFSSLLGSLVFAARNDRAFSAKTADDALDLFFSGEKIEPSDAITIGVHEVVENGAVVPVEIKTTLPDATSITILAEKNPNPLIASFNLGPECSGYIATRIKMAESSDIIVVINSSNRFYSNRKYVEVIAGGCT